MNEQLLKVSAKYAYGVSEPRITDYDKHGCLIAGTWKQIQEEKKKHPERWKLTQLDTCLPPLCMSAGIILLFYIILSVLQ
jgi:hypothetical protein